MRSRVCIISIVLSLAAFSFSAPGKATGKTGPTEKQYLERITARAKARDHAAANKMAFAFFKSYPKSPRTPDVWIILGDMETSPDRAIEHYRSALYHENFNRSDYARYRICEIEYLLSRWATLRDDALPGTRLAGSKYRDSFLFFSVIGLLRTEEYERAEKLCRDRLEKDHDYNNLARTLLILSSIHKATTGLSREYINDIREVAIGYGTTDAFPAALYLLGDFYERKRMYDESYSAYSDLISKYPGSPEAAEAAKKINSVRRHNPQRVFYLPAKKIVDDTESLEISPEEDSPDESEAPVYYAISVGPFSTMKSIAAIKKELAEFESVKTVKLSNGYALYVGRCPDEESALDLKVRLAEEAGINGRIVRVSAGDRQSFIYGE